MENYYKVNEVAQLAGVSVRSLHHYDKLGLLQPKQRLANGYRLYDEDDLLKLQQILFYKELNFSLKKISEIINASDFETLTALAAHRVELTKRKQQINQMLNTVDRTIKHIQMKDKMINHKDLYVGLNPKIGDEYRNEAIEKFGKETVITGEKELLKLGKTKYQSLQSELNQCTDNLFELIHRNPEETIVQDLIAQHYQLIRMFWGPHGGGKDPLVAYAGLGDLYVADERFTIRNGNPQPEFAKFLQKAMKIFAQK